MAVRLHWKDHFRSGAPVYWIKKLPFGAFHVYTAGICHIPD